MCRTGTWLLSNTASQPKLLDLQSRYCLTGHSSFEIIGRSLKVAAGARFCPIDNATQSVSPKGTICAPLDDQVLLKVDQLTCGRTC